MKNVKNIDREFKKFNFSVYFVLLTLQYVCDSKSIKKFLVMDKMEDNAILSTVNISK